MSAISAPWSLHPIHIPHATMSAQAQVVLRSAHKKTLIFFIF
jgi:hypothetical protein